MGHPVPVGVLVVIVNSTTPFKIEGVYVALTDIGLVPEVTIFKKLPLGADHVPEAALPVSVPTTIIVPFEQTD